MYTYRLKFKSDSDDSQPSHLTSPSPVEVGDVVPVENGFHHLVLAVEETGRPEPLLVLAKSGQSIQGAIDEAWPEQRSAALTPLDPATGAPVSKPPSGA